MLARTRDMWGGRRAECVGSRRHRRRELVTHPPRFPPACAPGSTLHPTHTHLLRVALRVGGKPHRPRGASMAAWGESLPTAALLHALRVRGGEGGGGACGRVDCVRRTSLALCCAPPPPLARRMRAGTTRLQLEHKGDDSHAYIDFANVVVAFAFLTIPVIGWLLDKKARACAPPPPPPCGRADVQRADATLPPSLHPAAGLWPDAGHDQRARGADERTAGGAQPADTSPHAHHLDGGAVFHVLEVRVHAQATRPLLAPQPAHLAPPPHTRTPLACSYFAIFGALFGFRNFGRLLAIDNTFNGLFGLLQAGRVGRAWQAGGGAGAARFARCPTAPHRLHRLAPPRARSSR